MYHGKVAINLLEIDVIERNPGETEGDAWRRMHARLGAGRYFEGTALHQLVTTVSRGSQVLTHSLFSISELPVETLYQIYLSPP